MKEKPILFSTPMAKAILEGRKTMTRRTIHPRYRPGETGFVVSRGLAGTAVSIIDEDGCMVREESPKYWPGDILWVKETWCALTPEHVIEGSYVYKADADTDTEKIRKECIQRGYPYQWKPSIHMPREAARLFLEVKAVRIERLRDITEEDAKAEGVGKSFLVDWLGQFDFEPPCWIYWDNQKRYWCEKHIEKGRMDFRKEAAEDAARYDLDGMSKEEIEEKLDGYMQDWIEEESPITCEICGKPLGFSALDTVFDDLDQYLKGSLTEYEAPMLESLMENYADELFSRKDIHRLLFSCLWNNINVKNGCSWETNPWVWVYEFEKVEK
jgi:hypothetical protein